MMRTPDAIPMHLMLAMMQSGILPSAYAPWNMNSSGWLPEWLRPKSPLEHMNEQIKNLWQQASEPWLKALSPSANPWLKNAEQKENNSRIPHASRANSSTRKGEATETASPFADNFADFFNDLFDPEFLTNLSSTAFNRSTGFLQGLQAYLASDYQRPYKEYKIIWQRGNARLLDLAPDSTEALAVLCVPSLINTSTILDLYPEVSFVDFLKERGFRPLILDWGSPNEEECGFTTADYISFYAIDSLHSLREKHDGPIALLGYCMGGIFATAMAQLAARDVDALVLLATPWDFSSADTPGILLAPSTQLMLRQWINTQYPVQPVVTQTIFHLIDPWRVQEKFSRYPTLGEEEKKHFLAVEQWVNDGVPLANQVAEECFVDWPQGNILAKHQWKIGRRWIEPELIACPTLAVIPSKDLIVPSGCALPLTKLINRCDTIMPESGHVSMVVGKNARIRMWEPVAKWLDEKF